jgi:RND family efflux transporter MFP subunit
MKATRLLIPLAGLALAGAVALQGRAPAAGSGAEAAAKTAALARDRVVAEGRLVAYPGAEITLAAEVAGTLVALPIVEKQEVRRGQLVARLRADDFEAELAEARAHLVEVDAEIRLAGTELARSETLLSKQVDTAARRDRAQRDLEVATARRATALAAIDRIGAELAKRSVVAPIDGVVLARPVDPGEALEARTPIATLADLARVRIEAEVDEFDAGRIRLGQAVTVRAEGYDGAGWTGTVEEIPDAVSGRRLKPQDPGRPSDTRVLLVKVKLDGPTPLKLGQRVEVEIRSEERG